MEQDQIMPASKTCPCRIRKSFGERESQWGKILWGKKKRKRKVRDKGRKKKKKNIKLERKNASLHGLRFAAGGRASYGGERSREEVMEPDASWTLPNKSDGIS